MRNRLVCGSAATKPFSFSESLWYLDRNFDDCMHSVNDAAVVRALSTNYGPGVIRVSETATGVDVEILNGDERALPEACGFVDEWLDLDRNIRPFYKLLDADERFAGLAKRYRGFHMVGIPDLFECLTWCIAGQQISLPFAYMLKRRLVEAYGEKIRCGDKTYFLFPRPEILASCSTEELRRFQLTTRKSEYIVGLSKAFARGEISKAVLASLPGEDAMVEKLLQFRGIGPWTANYSVMKSMRAMNRIPYGDAGIHQALQRFTGLSTFTKPEVDKIFDRFEGWKSYLVYYLWRSRRDMA